MGGAIIIGRVISMGGDNRVGGSSIVGGASKVACIGRLALYLGVALRRQSQVSTTCGRKINLYFCRKQTR